MNDIERFFDSYRTSFESFDVDRITEHFTFPCHIVSDADEVQVSSISSRDEWRALVEGLVSAYRTLGVATADALALEPKQLSSRVVHVGVHWALRTRAGDPVYDFHALYTLVRTASEFRIAAIAHDELPQLQAALARG